MNEFSTEFVFELQRFATKSFKGSKLTFSKEDLDETGITLSELFDSSGKAAINPGKNASSYSGNNNFFWDKSALVELTPSSNNTKDGAGAGIALVAGKYDDNVLALGNGQAGYVIKDVSVIDASGVEDATATFKTDTAQIVNPGASAAIAISGDTTGALTFGGGGEKEHDDKLDWDVGTVVNVKNDKITDVQAAAGEEITTADKTHATFENGGVATFDGKSFDAISAFAADGTAALHIDSEVNETTGETAIALNIDEVNTSATDGTAAINVDMNGQAIESITFNKATSSVDFSFGGKAIMGKDVTIQNGTINVDNLSAAEGSLINYTYDTTTDKKDIIDLTGADIKSGKDVSVSKTGNARYLFAKDEEEVSIVNPFGLETIKIGGTNYKFNDSGDAEGDGGLFLVSGDKATGFVLRQAGDAITLSKGMKNFTIYRLLNNAASNELNADIGDFSEDELAPIAANLSIDSDTSEYTVSQATSEDGTEPVYEIEVRDNTTVNIGGAEIGFKLPSTSDNKKTGTSAIITINADGKLTNIKAGTKADGTESTTEGFDVGGVEITFKGMADDAIDEKFTVGGVSFATSSGEFEYAVGGDVGKASTEVELKLTNETDEILTFEVNEEKAGVSAEDTKLVLAETESTGEEKPSGELTYKGLTFKYSNAQGNAYLTPLSGDALKFVFVDAGDALTVPEGGDALIVPYYLDKISGDETETPFTETPVVDGNEGYTITMTKATDKKHRDAEFEIVVPAGSTVTLGDATFEFAGADGKFFFGQDSTLNNGETVATGFSVDDGGSVIMNVAAAAALAQVDDDDKPIFKIDGTAVNIAAANLDSDELVYANKDEKSLDGLGADSAVVTAGAITKIYAPTDKGAITFGSGDDAKVYAAEAGAIGDNRAYFTVNGDEVVSFTFMVDNDEITSEDFSDLKFIDGAEGTEFQAPVITNENGENVVSTIIRTTEDINGTRTECYSIDVEDGFDDSNVKFGDGTNLAFEDANDDTFVYFSTEGKLLTIENFDTEGNRVIVSDATGEIDIDGNKVDVEGGGFTYAMLDADTPSLTDFKAGSNIIKLLQGIEAIKTVGGEEGIGGFTLGSGNEFAVDGTPEGVDGVVFDIETPDGQEITVAGISDIDGTESVTGALNGLLLNNSTKVSISNESASGTTDYTFSGTSFAGLVDGDNVVSASGITSFITGEEGAFEVLGTPMAIAGDSEVAFGVDENGSLTSVTRLDGTAIGDFTEELKVNNEAVKVTGDNSIAVTGVNDDIVTAIAGVSGASVALVQIGSASQVATDGNVGIEFVDAQQGFNTFTSDGVVFGIDENSGKVTSIDGIDQTAEGVAGNFNDGIAINGGLVQVTNGGEEVGLANVAVINGGASGIGIFGLLDGATVQAAEGISAAISVSEGTFTFADGKAFNIAGDSIVEFVLDGEGRVIAIDDLADTATVTGDLNGLKINRSDSPIDIRDDDTLSYNPATGLSGLEDQDTVVSADSASSVFVNGNNFEVEFANGRFTVEGDTDGVVEFLVTGENSNLVTGVNGLDEGATLKGQFMVESPAVAGTVNGEEFLVKGDSSFAVVGAENGVSRIFDLSDGASVIKAAGASVAVVDGEGDFYFGGELGGQSFGLRNGLGLSIADIDVAGTEFAINEDVQVTAINNVDAGGIVVGDINHIAINGGESIDVVGDEGDLGAFAKEDGVAILAGVGSASGVTVNSAGGANRVFTNVSDGKVKFTKSGQEFEVIGETEETANIGGQSLVDRVGVSFVLDDDSKVIEIGQLNGAVRGDFTEGIFINDPHGEFIPEDEMPQHVEQLVKVAGDSSILVKAGEGRVKAISEVNDGIIVENVGGASKVITAEEGEFFFTNGTSAIKQAFKVTDDNSVTFDMEEMEPAKVKGISDFAEDGNAAVAGTLNDVAINGASIAIAGDDDDLFTYSVVGGAKILGEVGGDDVQINAAGGADVVDATVEGNYTFGDKTYEVEDANGLAFGVDGIDVKAVTGLSGAVTGDVSANGFTVNGRSFQIVGDSDGVVKVVADNNGAPTRIEKFSDGASIIAAEGPSVAFADTEGVFTDARKVHIGVEGTDEAVFALDGHGNFVGVENTENATLSGDIGALEDINGGASIYVAYKDPETGETKVKENVTLAGGEISGIQPGDTILSTGGATKVVASEGNGGIYTFATYDRSTGAFDGWEVFSLEAGDNAGDIAFIRDAYTGRVTAIESLGGAKDTDGDGILDTNRFSYIKNIVLPEDSYYNSPYNYNAFNYITVNGRQVSVAGDADYMFGVAGWTKDDVDTGLESIYDVSGNATSSTYLGDPVTIYESGGANNVITDRNGLFIFDKANQKFRVTDEDPVTGKQSVTFNIDSREKVQGIYDLDGVVHGDFGDNNEPEDWGDPGIEINGFRYAGSEVNGYGNAVRVTGDRDGVSVVGSTDRGVDAIFDVDAGATVVTAANATMIGSDGEGIYTFETYAQNFTVKGDDSVAFMLDGDGVKNSVTGVEYMSDGKLTFNTDPNNYYNRNLTVNDEVNDEMAFKSTTDVTLTIKDSSVTAVEGLVGTALDDYMAGVLQTDSVTVTYTDIDRLDEIVVDDKRMYVQDYDNDFDVITGDYAVTRLERVTGDAIVNVVDGEIITDDEGEFLIGGKSYAFVDSDGIMTLTTDNYGDLDKVEGLKGTIELNDTSYNEVSSPLGLTGIVDGYEKVSINGNFLEVFSDQNVSITSEDGTTITNVDGLIDGDMINGDLDNASIAMDAADGISDPSDLIVNGIHYVLLADDTNDEYSFGNNTVFGEGVTVNGNETVHGIDGLKDGQRMLVVNKGTYKVNGTILEADVNDTIVGADTGAYLYDPDNVLIRKSTPVRDIAALAGVPMEVDTVIGSATLPVTKAELEDIFAQEDFDRDRRLEIYTTNSEEKVLQTIDFSEDKFTKKVHLYDGPQDLIFNDEGGNVAHVVRRNPRNLDENGVAMLTSGIKNIVLGDGAGDVVIVDEVEGIDNAVNITSGAGNDSIFVRDNVVTTIDMAKGGEDRVVTFAGAKAQIKLENYNATTGAGVQFDQWELQTPKDPTGRSIYGGNKISDAINSKMITFGDGVVSLQLASGVDEISINSAQGGTESVGGSIINLFTPEGKKQVVGFSHSAGSTVPVDGSMFDDDLILIGNNEGKKQGGSTLLGGDGNDTIYAGQWDYINAGAGKNIVSLEADDMREGARIAIDAAYSTNTTIENMNNTLDEIHGDSIIADLNQVEFEFDGTNLIVKSKDELNYNEPNVYAVIVDADKDGELLYDTATKATSADLASSADLAESADEEETTETTEKATSNEIAVAQLSSLTTYLPTSIPTLIPDHNYTNQIIVSGDTTLKAAIGAKGSVIDVKLDEDVRANYYKGEESGLTFDDGTYRYNGNVLIDLKGDWQAVSYIDEQAVIIDGINSIKAGTGENIIKGSDENETFFAGRGNTYLYGDGGKNLLVGYTGDDKEGQTTFYVLGHAADGVHSIQAFSFVYDDNYTNDSRITADKLDFDLATNYVSRASLSNDDVVIEVTNRDGSMTTESVVIQGAKGQDILVEASDYLGYDVIAQINDENLVFDKFANYYNAQGKNATISVINDQDYAKVWLDGSKGIDFHGDIKVIDATEFIGQAELAGNDYDNTVIASTVVGSGAQSLWGGNHGDDLLVAGASENRFYYTLGNGTDTILGAKDGDVVDLAGVTIDEIAGAEFSEIGVAIAFKDGGKLYIGDEGKNHVEYVVQGETYYVNENHNGFTKKA